MRMRVRVEGRQRKEELQSRYANPLDLYLLCFNFMLGSNFIFLFLLGMVMYNNEFKTKEDKI